VPDILRLIRELAEYEKSLDQVQVTADQLRETLFGPAPAVFALVADHEGAVAGFALWFLNYSTWTGRAGIYLEDLYVSPAVRGTGLGRALLAELAAVCVRRGYARLDWAVLNWNTPAIEFYRRIGATPQDEWQGYRLTGPALTELAARARA
jgi:GNAT superfamily N-acetyltransferase